MKKLFPILFFLFCLVLGCHSSYFKVQKTIMNPYVGGPLKLVARYDTARIYVYADTSSTNKIPDYVVMQGYEPIVWYQNTSSNTVDVELMERNFQGSLTTSYDKNENIQKRVLGLSAINSRFSKFIYADTNGDGLWDRYIDVDGKKAYVRSNSFWIPLHPTNAPQSH